MNQTLKLQCKRALVYTLCAAIAVPAPLYAAVTDISDGPLAQPATSVKPNMLLILDDSGSMARQFTPDYIASNANAGTVANCMDNREDGSVTTTPQDCFAGDPPMMSPDFNTQYYNPEIRYFPAVNYDGTSKGDMDSATTTGWTLVPTDNVSSASSDYARKNLHGGSLSSTTAETTNWDTGGNNTLQTMNLATEFPDRVWCSAPADSATDTTLCQVNSAYTYPTPTSDASTRFFAYGRDASSNRKYRFGAPYYYRIEASEFCTTSNLTTCISAAAATATHTFAAPVRYCDSTAHTNCQAKRTGTFRFPKFLGTINPGQAALAPTRSRGRIRIDAGDAGVPTINQISINCPTCGPGNTPVAKNLVTAPFNTLNTSTSGNRTTVATTIRDQINANTSAGLIHGYIACVPGSNTNFPGTAITCSGTPGTGTAEVNIIAPAVVAGPPEEHVKNNGSTITVTAPEGAKTPASVTFSIVGAGNGDTVNHIRFTLPAPTGTVNMLATGGYTFSCSAKGTACTDANMRNGVLAAIQARVGIHGFVATSSGTNSILLTAPTGTGAELNTITMVWSDAGLTDQAGALAGGSTAGDLSHTITNFTSGSDELQTVKPFRQNVGTFVRTNIVPAATFTKYPARSDCAAASCTYEEEMTNFANWFAYYRTRIQMAKTSIGRAFLVLGNSFRVGFMTINFSATHYLAVNDFTTTAAGQKDQWFTKLYSALASGSTPLRGALARAGQYYGNKHGGGTGSLSSTMGASPINQACQPSYSILTSDGYWNDSSGFNNLAGTAVGNQDSGSGNPPAEITPYATKASGSWDGNAASNTLADVAMYYYKTDLRPDLSDQVPPSGIDTAPHQHMTTFTVGMGLAGTLTFDSNYQSQTSGDFFDIKQGTKLWPTPSGSNESTLDDLWHAAVNGRGRFFSAQDPIALASGISETLNSVQSRIGAGAAAATSNLQPVAGDNFAFTAQYQTVEWSGDLRARTIDLSSGSVATRELWSAQTLLDARSHLTRRIFTYDATDTNASLVVSAGASRSVAALTQAGGVATATVLAHGYSTGSLVVVSGAVEAGFNGSFALTVIDANNFTYPVPGATPATATGVITAAPGRQENANRLRSFCPPDSDVATYPQCNDGGLLTTTEANDYFDPDGGVNSRLDQANTWIGDGSNRAASADPANLIHYLRGERTNEMTSQVATGATDLYRARVHLLGDIVNAQPAYVKAPPFSYTDANYSAFKTAQSTRLGRVYAAANDGMLHAFSTDPDNSPYYQTAGIATIVTSDDTFSGTLDTNPVSGEGSESWAYVPRLAFPKVKRLAEIYYSTNHAYTVDGTPVIADVCFGQTASAACAATANWRTILVAGLNNGGRGYYALDVTDPANPKGLWELTGGSDATCIASDAAVDGTQTGDCNIGRTFGNPIIAKLPDSFVNTSYAGKWVVLLTSGHNNVSPGDGVGHFYVIDAETGKILMRKTTSAGSVATPSGLTRINAYVEEANINNTALTVYGGDLLGNMWRFQLEQVTNTAPDQSITSGSLALLASVKDPSNVGQSITVRPELGKVDSVRVVYFGTGRFLGVSDKSDFQRNTVYAIKDTMKVLPGSTATAITDMTRAGSGAASTINNFVRQTLVVDTGNSSLRTVKDPVTGVPNSVSFSTQNGFFIDLPDGGSSATDPSERVNVDPILQLGTLVVPSNVVSSDTCVAGGFGWVNFFDYRSGAYVPGSTSNAASQKISASLIVGINVVQLPGGTVKTIVTTADNQQLTQDTPVAPSAVSGRRVSWRELFVE